MTNNAERIGKAVAEVAKRVRIQDFDVIGIQGTVYLSTGKVHVSVQCDTTRDVYKAVSYFGLAAAEVRGGITLSPEGPVVGLRDALVMVYGPAPKPAPVAIVCSECGVGHYIDAWIDDSTRECDECGHAVGPCDIELEAGETLTTLPDGTLGYFPAED